MKKQLLYYYTLFLLIFLSTCTKDEYVVILPMSDIYLSEPSDNQAVDLNVETVNKYHFSWNKICEGGNTLILSKSPVLLDPVTVNVGESQSYDLSVSDADRYFSILGVESGKTGIIYWSVKPTKELTVAASDIRLLNVKRIASKLEAPIDQYIKSLDFNTPNETLQFSWNTDDLPENTAYSIRFGTNAELSGNVVTIPVGAVRSAAIRQEQLQTVLEGLPHKKYETVKLYWNIIKNADNTVLSKSSCVLFLNEMMIFKDVRGNEIITYKVAKLKLGSKNQVWLAENLRATKYPDGTDIESNNIRWAPASLGNDYVKVYGAYYTGAAKMKVVPKGWTLPSVADYETLFGEAALAPGRWNVLKDPQYYAVLPSQNNLNDWGLGLVTAGQWSGDAIVNQKQVYCYLMASDTEASNCILHDGGGTLWFPWTTGAPIRIYYTGE